MAQMHFRLFSFALVLLNCMDYGYCQVNRGKRNKRANSGPYPICKGCLLCSKDNGCLSCQQKLFFFLRREGMRQYGECLHSCPSGYYGLRAPEMNRCARCKIENCEMCFSKDFCTKCKAGSYLHKGRCFEDCPEGFVPLEDNMECVGYRIENCEMCYGKDFCTKYKSSFHCGSWLGSVGTKYGCEVGQWSNWGTCIKNNKTCGYKWGLETRTRQIVKKPAKDTIPCPTIAESRRCKMAKRHCPGEKSQRTKGKSGTTRKKKKRIRSKAHKQHSVLQATESTDQ